MSDRTGLAFFVILLIAAFAGLKSLASPKPRTSEEFGQKAAEGTTMLSPSMHARLEMMNPEAAKANEVEMQMKNGRYRKQKKREGKAGSGSTVEEK